MDRTKPVKFFSGLEIEKTNHFLLPTMIAPGQYDFDKCKQMLDTHNMKHILIGFMYDPAGNPLEIDLERAFSLVNRLMAEGYKVTVEIRPDQLTDAFVAKCPEADSTEAKLFVILIGSYFPNMAKIGGYTTLKLHSDYNSDNKGVWTMPASKFRDTGDFTRWEAYELDIWLE